MAKRKPSKSKSKKTSSPGLATWARLFAVAGMTYVGCHLAVFFLAQFGVFNLGNLAGGLTLGRWLYIAELVVTIAVTVVVATQWRWPTPRRAKADPQSVAPHVDVDPWIANLARRAEEFFTGRSPEEVIHDLALLYRIGQGISATIDLQELLDRITDLVQRHLKLREFAILLMEEEGRYLQVKASYGFADREQVNDMIFRVGEGISGEVARSGEMLYVRDTDADPRYLHYRGASHGRGALVSIPLEYKRAILGVVNFGRPGAGSFSESEIHFLRLVANQISLAIANARLYSKTRELAIRDDLTGLYNRRHFLEVLQVEWKRALRFRRGLAILMIDVDYFKAFNDTHGHLYGDEVLRQISDILRRNLREVDTLARFGGEEFIALLPDTDQAGAVHVGEKLRRIVESERFPVPHESTVNPLTISVGVSLYPNDALQIDDLIDHADVALYEAKDGGRNRVVVYPALGADDNEHTPLVSLTTPRDKSGSH